MKKPDNYMELSIRELHDWVHPMLLWNCSQPMSDSEHKAHYDREIAQLYARIDELWEQFWEKEWLK